MRSNFLESGTSRRRGRWPQSFSSLVFLTGLLFSSALFARTDFDVFEEKYITAPCSIGIYKQSDGKMQLVRMLKISLDVPSEQLLHVNDIQLHCAPRGPCIEGHFLTINYGSRLKAQAFQVVGDSFILVWDMKDYYRSLWLSLPELIKSLE